MTSDRMRRVDEAMREVLSGAITSEIKDPRVGFVTVTGVKVTPDLRRAWVFYTSFGDDKARAGTRAALRSARPHLRSTIGRQVRLKYLPDLEFEEDQSLENGQRIDELIRKLHEEGSG